MKSDKLHYLYSNTSLSFLIRIGGVVALFIGHALLARGLSTSEYGRYAYLIELAALLSVVASLGFNQIAVRTVPDFIRTSDAWQLRRFIRAGVLTTLLSTVGIAPIIVAAWWFDALPGGITALQLGLAITLLSLLSLMRFGQEILRGARKIVRSQIFEQLAWPALLIAIGATIPAGLLNLGVADILAVHAAAFFVFSIIIFTTVRRSDLTQRRPDNDENVELGGDENTGENWKVWLGIGVPLAVSGVLSVFLKRGDILALGTTVTSAEIAPYAAAVRIAGLMIFGLAAANAVAAPLMREMFAAGNRAALQGVIDRSAAMSTLFSLPLAMLFIAAPHLFLGIFGPDYVDGAPVLRILAFGQLINALTGPVGPSMVATGMQKLYLKAVGAAAAGMVAALTLLVPAFGMIGAAVAAASVVALLNVLLAVIVYRKLRLRVIATPAGVARTISEALSMAMRLVSRRNRT